MFTACMDEWSAHMNVNGRLVDTDWPDQEEKIVTISYYLLGQIL